MKAHIIPLLLLLFTMTTHAQTTIVLRPGPEAGKDAMVWDDPVYNKAVRNYGSYTEMLVHAWSDQGTAVYARSYIAFDLASVQRTDLLSATLTLYNNPDGTFDGKHQQLSGPNRAWIRRVITPWEEDKLTWHDQPAYTEHHQVLIPASVDGHQSYTIDVTELVRDMLTDFRDSSQGFVIILEEETPYRALVFATSDHQDAARHPQLELVFTGSTAVDPGKTPASMDLEIFPNPASGQVDIHAKLPAGNAGYVDLLNELGHVLRSWDVSGQQQLHLSLTGFASGHYWLRIGNDAGVAVKQLIVR